MEKKLFNLRLFLVIFLFLISCKKEEKTQNTNSAWKGRLSGNYSCTVRYYSWQMNQPPSESFGTDTINASFVGDTLLISFTKLVLKSSDASKKEYVFQTPTYYSASGADATYFMNQDSLFYTSHSGGLGCGYSTTYYGKKIQ